MERHHEEPFAFETLPAAEPRPAWALGAERGLATGAIAVVVGPLPSCLSYLWHHWGELSPDTWGRLIVQTMTFVVVTGAIWGLAVGVALALVRRRAPLYRWGAGALAGAGACVPAGVFAAVHFGQEPTPYFGGVAIVAGAVTTTLLAAAGFARAEGGGALRALGCALASLPLAALVLVPLAVLLPAAALLLELDALRALAAALGLGSMGAVVGAAIGAFCGGWTGLATAIAARR